MLSLQRVSLPGSLDVWAPSPFEAAVIYREIVTERTYERHGIAVHEGDTIFDVGANIGLFALHMTRTIPGLKVHAFEPLPEIFEALQRNMAEHIPDGTAYNLGLADRTGEATFEFDRFSTISTTMHARVFDEGADRTASITTWASAALADFEKLYPGRAWALLARKGLDTPVLRAGVLLPMALAFMALRVRRRLFLRRTKCRLQTLSEALAASGADQVALVKIDVEGAEESVLAGIADQDWSRLRQFVIEVHDIDGRLDRMTQLLERHGYRTIRSREDWEIHALLGISTLYAIG